MTEPLTTSNTLLRHKIKCHYSGLTIGLLEVQTTAGALPYLTHWDKCVAYHPVFSLDTQRLLRFAKGEWERLAQRAADQEVTEAESNILRVSYLAMLHTLECIRQDQPSLPPLAIVHSTIQKLFNLSLWKWKLESERFKFPTLHISKFNTNLDFSNMGDYLDLCFDVRKNYELGVKEMDEREKVAEAERAILALNSTWVTPTSKKLLWQWVRAHLPAEYAADAEGWLSTLFLGGSAAILEFDKDEIELAEEIVISNCPAGSTVVLAVKQRLAAIMSTWEQFHEAYTIDLEDYAENANLYVNGEKVTAKHPGPEPVIAEFGFNRSHYYVAHAKWSIAKAAFIKDGGIL